ncbi:MAG: Long-chain-fatty-acid--CoA ligase FadD15 [Thermoanaerobaculia bacterium]|nr:Long-chain-fatty-acid--CoA ligase FadD15 [Thermoanaerobaculia bacterium]
MTPRTLVDIFRNLKSLNKPDLHLYKKDGQWHPISSNEFIERVKWVSCALEGLGVGQGDRVALLSENRTEWATVDFACQCYGAVMVPIFPTMVSAQAEYLLQDSGTVVAFASTDEQAKKVLDAKGNCPKLKHVVVFNDLHEPGLISYESLLAEGKKIHESNPSAFDQRADSRTPDDLATLIYTSGTTGEPKGAMLTQNNFVSNVLAGCQVLPFDSSNVALSFLPLSHVFERLIEYCYYHRGATIAFAESIDALKDNLLEVNPTLFGAVPRVYEKVYGRIHDKVAKGTPLQKKIFESAIETGKEVLELRQAKKSPGAVLAAKHFLFEKLVYGKIRAALGSRFRLAISGGAPLAKDLAQFFWGIGVEIYEGYGLTETSPVIAVNTPSAWKLGTVGRVLPGVEVKIAEDGEILARGPNIMKGYFNKPEATREAIDPDGWFHTGDIGIVDEDGFLKITDRKKELIVNSNGKNIAPAPLENALKTEPFISQAVIIGDRRKFLSCLIVPNLEKLADWANSNGMAGKRAEDLIADERVKAIYQKILDRANTDKPHEQMIRRFMLLPAEFTIEGGELTPKLSVKRRVVDTKYKDLIDQMYAGSKD